MMSTKPTPAANADLDSFWGAGLAGGFYVDAVVTVTDGDAGTVVYATGGAHVAQAISFAAAAARSKANSLDITFPVATVNHGNIVAWAVRDAVAGNLKHLKVLATPITYNTGYQPVIEAGTLAVQYPAYTG
jgi:hypothetical protein